MRTRLHRGAAAAHDTAILPDGMLSVNQDTHTLHLHDGTSPGGVNLSRPVGLQGPTDVVSGNGATYTVVGYDTFSTYTVTARDGSATIEGDVITYTAPGLAGTDVLTVTRNGVSRRVTINLMTLELVGTSVQLSGGPPARDSHTSVAIDGLLYVFGGQNSGGDLADLWVYDPATDGWTELTSDSIPRKRHTAVVHNGKMIIFGGDGTSLFNDVRIYDPATDSWSAGTPATLARRSHAAAVIGDTMYIFGGKDDSSVELTNLEAYDLVQETWSSPSPTGGPSARYTARAAVIDDLMYLYGGSPSAGEMWAYDPQANTWEQRTSNGSNLLLVAATAFGGKFYAAFGNASGFYYSELSVYDPATDTWSLLGDIATDRRAASFSTIGSYGYIFGGFNHTNAEEYFADLWKIG